MGAGRPSGRPAPGHMTATLDGYVTGEGDVTIAAGVMTPGQDVLLHRVQPHALIEGGPFTVVLRPGKSATQDHRHLELRGP